MSRAALQLRGGFHKKKERAAKGPLKEGAQQEWEETLAPYLCQLISPVLSLFSQQLSSLQSLFSRLLWLLLTLICQLPS